MIRNPELQDAYAKVKADKKRQREDRKAAARDYLRARKEAPAPGQRAPRERNNGFLAFVRRHRCCVCGASPVDACHIRYSNPAVGRINPGLQSKPSDRWCVPACRACHERQHSMNERAYWASVGIDPDALANRLYAAFLAGGEPIQLAIRTGEK